MIKLCDIKIVKPQHLIYTECLVTRRFQSHWEKANVSPIHKKREQTVEENDRLNTSGKMFKKLTGISQKNSLSCLESCSLNWRRFERNFSRLWENGLAGEIVCVLNSDLRGHIRKFLAGFWNYRP